MTLIYIAVAVLIVVAVVLLYQADMILKEGNDWSREV